MGLKYRHAVARAFVPVLSLVASGLVLSRAQAPQLPVEHPECEFYGPRHDEFLAAGLNRLNRARHPASDLTVQVAGQLPSGMQPAGLGQALADRAGTIDKFIFQGLKDAGVTPAGLSTDFEFIRRVTLDLTGRIPTPDRVLSFVADTTPNKRAALVDELLAKPEWVDKWTMYFGDQFKNTAVSTQVTRYVNGRNAFYYWIHDSLAQNTPYNQMVYNLISIQGTNSYLSGQGETNWLVGGIVTGGPQQDIWDQQTASAAETFLGIAHVNCLLCHDGRGHLDTLSLWASKTTRVQAWGLSSFLSHSVETRTQYTQNGQPVANTFYWWIDDNNKSYQVDYPLNTTTGNRPARQPVGAVKNIAPVYIFNGGSPAKGENYRAALARLVTNDFQFARATVNYIWAQFFEIGLVDPPNQFDPARLDPYNPPPSPWTLQPSNARLLDALAVDFVNSGYDLKALMREIATSQSYQLSARYNGNWNPAWETLFARKLVRRLWGEEIHDALAQASRIIPSYNVTDLGTVNWAMQLPEPSGLPGGSVTAFLDAFLRGNRDDQPRSSEGSLQQALGLMNDPYVMTHVRATGSGANASLLQTAIALPNDQLVQLLYLNVLSRYPTDCGNGQSYGATGRREPQHGGTEPALDSVQQG